VTPFREPRIASAADALAVLAKAGALTIVPTGRAVPSLVGAIAGEPIKGSWWSHPAGKAIFRIASAVEASDRVLAAKLIDGKITLLDRAHWPALIRVVTDRGWRAPRIDALAPPARALLDQVERAGELHADDAALTGKAFTAARRALDLVLLVRSTSEHTERGHHASTLSSWTRWCPPPVATAARKLTLADARASLAAVLHGPLA